MGGLHGKKAVVAMVHDAQVGIERDERSHEDPEHDQTCAARSQSAQSLHPPTHPSKPKLLDRRVSTAGLLLSLAAASRLYLEVMATGHGNDSPPT